MTNFLITTRGLARVFAGELSKSIHKGHSCVVLETQMSSRSTGWHLLEVAVGISLALSRFDIGMRASGQEPGFADRHTCWVTRWYP